MGTGVERKIKPVNRDIRGRDIYLRKKNGWLDKWIIRSNEKQFLPANNVFSDLKSQLTLLLFIRVHTSWKETE